MALNSGKYQKLTFGDFYTIVWNMVPSVWRDADDQYGKSLQIVLYTMAQHMYYYFYNKIVYMDELFDPDLCPEKYLRFLAGMVGWTLQGSDPALWREQIKAAPLLYKIRGTKRGLLLAEKLVGYSVFMSEMYRDHIGDIVPKERIFNNTPTNITTKPWFRNVLTSLEGELLPGKAESDQFDAFNFTGMVKLSPTGNVIRPRIVTNTRTLVFTPSSTTSRYNNLTGQYSLARYAKLPRINVVLQYNNDLDAQNPDGTVKENNFSGALDLLLQFKPFHVFIENLEVRYDVSEFIYDQTAINSDIFNVQEELDSAVVMTMDRAENTITYSTTPAVDVIPENEEAPISQLDNRGVITSIYKTIDLSSLTPNEESSLYDIAKKSMPVKTFPVGDNSTLISIASIGNNIYTLEDLIGFTPVIGTNNYMFTDMTGTIEATVNNPGVFTIYNPGHDVLQYNISNLLSDPVLDFKSMFSSQQGITDFINQTTTPDSNGYDKILATNYIPGLTSSVISSVSSTTQPYRSIVSTTYDTQALLPPTTTSTLPSRPWDLQALSIFNSSVLSSSMTNTALFKSLYDNTFMVVLETTIESTTYSNILTHNIDYYFDNTNNIYLNSSTIAPKVGNATDYTFLLNSKLHILYLSRITYSDETENGIPIRGFRYTTRINHKFTRQTLTNTTKNPTLESVMPTQVSSVNILNGGTQQKTVIGTKKFRTPTNIYNRSYLKNQLVDGHNVVSRNPLNRLDKTQWEVYSPEYTAVYLGDQVITNNWWGNYYNVSSTTESEIPYTSIDTSEAAQLKDTNSDQWAAALQLYNPSDPNQFLVSRTINSNRANIWNRSSCKLASVPYIQSRRDNLQVFRNEVPAFNRSEQSTDYAVDTSTPPRVDNYKYVLSDGTDVSLSYFSPGFSDDLQVVPILESGIGQKATINSTGYGLTFPSSDTYYDNASSGTNQSTYFTEVSPTEYNIKTSLYAGNMPTNLNPSTIPGINEGLDALSLLVTGLVPVTDTFTVVDNTITTYNLSQSNIWVVWSGVDSGQSVAFGFYSSAAYGINVFPNIKLFLNGILLQYGTSWTLGYSAIKSITVLDPIDIGDIITVEYEELPGQSSNPLPSPLYARTLNYTLTSGDIAIIQEGNRYLYDLPHTGEVPCVAWYNGTQILANYINSSSNPIQYQPFGLYDVAAPNVVVIVNGITTVYKRDWTFLFRIEGSNTIASIALNPNISLGLVSGNTIEVEYFSTS